MTDQLSERGRSDRAGCDSNEAHSAAREAAETVLALHAKRDTYHRSRWHRDGVLQPEELADMDWNRQQYAAAASRLAPLLARTVLGSVTTPGDAQ